MKRELNICINWGERIQVDQGYLFITSQNEERVQYVEYSTEVERRIQKAEQDFASTDIRMHDAVYQIILDSTHGDWRLVHSPEWWLAAFKEYLEMHGSISTIENFENFSEEFITYWDVVIDEIEEERTPFDSHPAKEQLQNMWSALKA